MSVQAVSSSNYQQCNGRGGGGGEAVMLWKKGEKKHRNACSFLLHVCSPIPSSHGVAAGAGVGSDARLSSACHNGSKTPRPLLPAVMNTLRVRSRPAGRAFITIGNSARHERGERRDERGEPLLCSHYEGYSYIPSSKTGHHIPISYHNAYLLCSTRRANTYRAAPQRIGDQCTIMCYYGEKKNVGSTKVCNCQSIHHRLQTNTLRTLNGQNGTQKNMA